MPGSSRLGAFTRLARVSNLPTVWSNVLAGTAAGSAIDGWSAVDGPTLAVTLLSASAFYTGGMFLNDAFDEPYDRSARPERPIPRGDVTRREAFTVGGALLAFGIAATMAGAIGRAAAAGALMMVAYVAGLTVVARRAGADARWLVPALIAGISLVDALFIAVVRPAAISIAWVAALGFPLTLVLQRWVPGD
jgi:4-hydroxybenzoate polyprenyltransferase